MTSYFPGPGILELEYTVAGLTHKYTMNLDHAAEPSIGTAFDDIDLNRRGGGTISVGGWIALLEAGLDGMYNNAGPSFDVWNYYVVAPNSYDRTLIGSETPGSQPNVATGTVESSQETFTFRTEGGNIAKAVLLECNYGQNDCVPYADLLTQEKVFVDVCIAANTPMIGRDGEFVYSFIRRCAGQNEKTWRQRNRA